MWEDNLSRTWWRLDLWSSRTFACVQCRDKEPWTDTSPSLWWTDLLEPTPAAQNIENNATELYCFRLTLKHSIFLFILCAIKGIVVQPLGSFVKCLEMFIIISKRGGRGGYNFSTSLVCICVIVYLMRFEEEGPEAFTLISFYCAACASDTGSSNWHRMCLW